MGYYTRFEGSVTGPREFIDEFVEKWESESSTGDYYGFMPIDFTMSEFFGGEAVSWYAHDEDITRLSSEHPYLLFALSGEGEESGDIWKSWYRNGKHVTVQARIVFDEPDLDVELPTPDVSAALERIRETSRQQIRDQIRDLKAKLHELS